MAITPEGVIREARDLSPSYEERAHPNGVMLRSLDSYEKEVSQRVAKIYPPLLAEIFVVDLPLASFADGIALELQRDPQPPDPDAPDPVQPIYVLPGMQLASSANETRQEAEIVNLTLRNRPADYCGRVGFLQRNRLYLSGSERSWTGISSIELNIVFDPPPVTSLTQPLQMPMWTHDLYVGHLVKLMSIREGDQVRMAIGQSMIEDVWQTIAQQKGAESFVTVDAWP